MRSITPTTARPQQPRPGGERIRGLAASVGTAALIAAALVAGSGAAAAPTDAPGAPGAQATWSTGAKQGFGTATSTASKVWYTLADGTMSEVYYPRVDVANSRSLELIVTDGKTFADLESKDTTHAVKLLDPKVLLYSQINTDKDKRYQLIKTYVTDPKRATVIENVTLRSLDGGKYQVYVQYDPSLANSGMHDSARTVGGALVAEDLTGADKVGSALIADRPFAATSNGFAGASDGWSDLAGDFHLDHTYTQALDGNVVQTAKLNMLGTSRLSTSTLALGFGATGTEALATAKATMSKGLLGAAATTLSYIAGWHSYLGSIKPAPASVKGSSALTTQYNVAAMTLKAHEDKTYRGANIASLTVPWGQAQNANEAGVGGYHLVWARDLYQVSSAQIAIGDTAAANRSLDYLFDVQQKPDGSFPQNSLLNGTPYWGSLQLDEVAFPIVLAWQLKRADAATYTDHVKKAADFIVSHGPATPQERWEEEGGYSPSTIAAEIAGLTAASALAKANGDDGSAAVYQGVADQWQRSVESWTYTTTGPIGDGNYYERIDDNGNPNDGHTVDINNGGGAFDERSIVDAGFLDLVRLGVKAPTDAAVASSLPEVDATIKVDTPNGAMWYRYNHDGYGEKADGSPYDGTGVGRLWPLLSGERGEYELANGRSASSYLKTMAASANEGYLIPEQVWDQADPASSGFSFGEGTGSATPLAWSMAQFVRLAQSIDAGKPVETPSVVSDRYASGSLPAGPALTLTAPTGAVTSEATVTVAGTTDAAAVWVSAGGATVAASVSGGSFTADVPLALGANTITVVAVGANGGTTTVQRGITSTNFGTPLGTIADPTGDDNGPGDYVYPTNSAFNAGAFDVTGLGVYDDGQSINLVTTIAGDIQNPWGGNQLSVQRLDIYVSTDAAGSPVAAQAGTNADLAHPYAFVIGGSGFITPTIKDASGAVLGNAGLLVLPDTHQIALSVPKALFGSTDLAAAGYQVAMMSHADPNGEGVGGIRPVYDRAYWDSAPANGQSWIQEYRFGGGAGEYTDANAARDTDSRDPNTLDILAPAGQSQSTILDWRASSPVVLPYVPLG
ncbi:glucan 1,4-alpha-glucosidase [Glaciibacter flavus]|uniref:Glucan 1,4-alpha-glucosidase n=1 Tax=Orlajensenia flava TaxID=2565934 RepID=A0A4S4FP65_9MICO|nr:glucan 1,4-alpha-glucosidase [Glaciibacter flavus]THG31325.1 glucan 1,4-alpha-glucosidase [Glaciibacter flavus]